MELPASFVTRTQALLGKEEYAALATALQGDPSVSVRLNPQKTSRLPFFPQLSGLVNVPWCKNGYYLPRKIAFTFDPLFHAGCYYVQEASSMFIEQAICQYIHKPVVMLDLCAAPGGKSTHIRSLLPEESLLVSNELIPNRARILTENLVKWGDPSVIVTHNDPADFSELEALFDVILADVPCSGEGMFRKDSAAISEWSLENVNICWQRQRRILADIWLSLKPGGILLYSTCTYNAEENEANVRWLMDEFGAVPLMIDIEDSWQVTGNLGKETFPVYRFLPHKTRGEGFFLAVLRKPESSDTHFSYRKPKKEKKKVSKTSTIPREISGWLVDAEKYLWETDGTTITAFPKVYMETYALLKQTLRCIHTGIRIGELKGKDIIPDQSLAFSNVLNRSAFPISELSYKQAIAYLRKEAITLDNSSPRGYILLTYKNIPLGFAKNLGNRANNLYPPEWRIRSGYLPEDIKELFLLTK